LKAVRPRLSAAPPRLAPAPKTADPFYLSIEWRRLVAAIKRQRGAWCQRCGSGERVLGDHIVERKDGGAELAANNIELLCQRCHQAKTAKARAERALGSGR
jgi:5-methylcytosine-specific restriction endonuclease McrA